MSAIALFAFHLLSSCNVCNCIVCVSFASAHAIFAILSFTFTQLAFASFAFHFHGLHFHLCGLYSSCVACVPLRFDLFCISRREDE